MDPEKLVHLRQTASIASSEASEPNCKIELDDITRSASEGLEKTLWQILKANKYGGYTKILICRSDKTRRWGVGKKLCYSNVCHWCITRSASAFKEIAWGKTSIKAENHSSATGRRKYTSSWMKADSSLAVEVAFKPRLISRIVRRSCSFCKRLNHWAPNLKDFHGVKSSALWIIVARTRCLEWRSTLHVLLAWEYSSCKIETRNKILTVELRE